jgi:hypothetical protein
MRSDLLRWLFVLVWGAALSFGFDYGLVCKTRPQSFPEKVRSWLPMSAIAGLGVLTSLVSSGNGFWTTAFFCLVVMPPIIAVAMAIGRPGFGNPLIDAIYGDRAERDRRAQARTYRPVEFNTPPPSAPESRSDS